MESKLLQALINENNLNKKIEQLQKEIEIYRNKISMNNLNGDLRMFKIDKTMSTSFNNDKKDESSDRYNENNDYSINNNTNNDIKTNKKKNSHNSVCITNSSNGRIKNIIKINKSINIKSKSPTYKYQNFKGINPNIKRNHSERDDKMTKNNKENNQNINKNNIKKQNIEDINYKGYLITDLNKNESINFNNKKKKKKKNNNN